MFDVAGFRPGSRATFVSAKVAKTIDAPSGFIKSGGTPIPRKADQLAGLKQGPPADKSVPPVGQPAGVRSGEMNAHRDSHLWETVINIRHTFRCHFRAINLTNFGNSPRITLDYFGPVDGLWRAKKRLNRHRNWRIRLLSGSA